jgi:hypothetical protein
MNPLDHMRCVLLSIELSSAQPGAADSYLRYLECRLLRHLKHALDEALDVEKREQDLFACQNLDWVLTAELSTHDTAIIWLVLLRPWSYDLRSVLTLLANMCALGK